MASDVRHVNDLTNGRERSSVAGAGRFAWHFVQMLVAMMAGMMIYHVLVGKVPEQYRVLWYAGMELSMVPPMIALMLWQKHGWRCSIEMAAAMLIGPAILLTCAQLGLHNYVPGLTRGTLLTLADVTMYLGMLGAMLYRRQMYTRPHTNHQHAGTGHTGHAAASPVENRAQGR